MREFINGDCMEGMKTFPDKYFDLAIVDPPYGDTVCRGGYMQGAGTGVAPQRKYNNNLWDMRSPGVEYFNELFRVSCNQIIWGGNHLSTKINKDSSCWVVWDKNNSARYADGELAWTSFDTALRIFKYTWNGMIQEEMGNKKENRIHPTQKPIALYKWLLKNYAKPGMKILDTHVGSASSLIAFEEFGLDYVGYELDPDYYKAACERLEKYREQLKLFEPSFEK